MKIAAILSLFALAACNPAPKCFGLKNAIPGLVFRVAEVQGNDTYIEWWNPTKLAWEDVRGVVPTDGLEGNTFTVTCPKE